MNTAVNQTASSTPVALTVTGSAKFFSLGAGSSAQYQSSARGSSTSSVSDAGALAAFYASNGATVFDVFGQTLTGTVLSLSGGNADVYTNAALQTSFGVSYDYSPTDASAAAVPEPASLALVVTGLCGVGGVARQRRSRREAQP